MSKIKIYYTTEVICNEPGPNMFWIGPGDSFRSLINAIYPLARGKKKEVSIKSNDNFFLDGIDFIQLIQQENYKKQFILKEKDNIIITLDKMHWRNVIHIITTITFEPSENYIDFEEEGLREDANWIIESSE